jgi:hypothetical protein
MQQPETLGRGAAFPAPRDHKSLKMTPAESIRLTKSAMTMGDIVDLIAYGGGTRVQMPTAVPPMLNSGVGNRGAASHGATVTD